jgi:hypothetical protein
MKALQVRHAMARTTVMRPFARVHIEGLISGGGLHRDGDVDGSSIACSRCLSQNTNSITMITPIIRSAMISSEMMRWWNV